MPKKFIFYNSGITPFSYNTFDPSNKGTNVTVSGGNLTAGNTVFSWASIFGLGANSHSTGKYYAEFLCNNVPGGNAPGIGIGNASSPLNNYCGSNANGWVFFNFNAYYHSGGAVGLTPPAFTFGDRIMMAADLTTGKMWFGINGVWNNSGNPAAGTNQAFTITTGVTYYPICSFFSANVTANFGASAYTYTPPSGFGNW